MAEHGQLLYQKRDRLMFAMAGLMLAMGGVFLSDPLWTLSEKSLHNISILLHVYVYVYFLTPITFYINILSLFLLIATLAAPLEPPLPVFLQQYLPRAAGTVSLANLLLGGPILVYVSVSEENVGFAVGATLIVLSLVFIFASVFKKILISNCLAGRGLMPSFFALCISVGTSFISFESIFKFDKKHHDSLVLFIPIQLLFSIISFFVFMLGIALLLIWIVDTSAGGPHVPIYAHNLLISALCVVTATLLVGWYMNAYMTVTGMGSVPADAVELL